MHAKNGCTSDLNERAAHYTIVTNSAFDNLAVRHSAHPSLRCSYSIHHDVFIYYGTFGTRSLSDKQCTEKKIERIEKRIREWQIF